MEPLRVSDRGEWANWLDAHAEAREVWLTIRKKNSKRPGITLDEAVEEALTRGWIDSGMRPVDAEEYILHFTPRRGDSPWSMRNRKIVERLIVEGRMTEVGMRCVKIAKISGKWDSAYSSQETPDLPTDLEATLRRQSLYDKFRATTNSNQLQYIYWIGEAKKPETRARRTMKLLAKLRESN